MSKQPIRRVYEVPEADEPAPEGEVGPFEDDGDVAED